MSITSGTFYVYIKIDTIFIAYLWENSKYSLLYTPDLSFTFVILPANHFWTVPEFQQLLLMKIIPAGESSRHTQAAYHYIIFLLLR